MGKERKQERDLSHCSLRVAALAVNAVARQRGTRAKRIRNVFAKKDSEHFGVCLRCCCVAQGQGQEQGGTKM